jgi:glycosyltransferase involved in cell wall biosynthesis
VKILFVADGRSPTSINWIRYWTQSSHQVYLVSTVACEPELDLDRLDILPVAFSRATTSLVAQTAPVRSSRTIGLRAAIKHWFAPLTISRASHRLKDIIRQIQPDIIHAMRIPYEGMLAADAYSGIPLVVGVWGNDFTLHAPSTPLMRHYTRWTMQVADALHADCERDIRLGREWGFPGSRPTLVTPGNGGIRTDIFYPPEKAVEDPVIINPRGFRKYVRNDTFFRSIPLVLQKIPDARFLCTSMAGQAEALKWVERLDIDHAVELLAPVAHEEMPNILRGAALTISPSTHDGTPNSLLESMACGCFPIVGDLESLREWITDGENGLLIDPSSPEQLAESMVLALNNKNLRELAAGLNAKRILEKGEYFACMAKVETFYESLVRREKT